MFKTKNLTLALSLGVLGYAVAFDSGKKAEWKKDTDGRIVVDESGDPVMVLSDGSERSLGTDTVSRLNAEARTNRERAEQAETKLRPYEGLDAGKAKEALETVGKLDQKKLIDAGEVDRVKENISKTFTTQIDELQTKLNTANERVSNMTRETAFRGSKYIQDNISVPVDMLMGTFGNRFKYEDGELVPYGADGQKLLSRTKAGEVATFDEAMSIYVDGYSSKDAILKSGGHSGSGNGGGGGSKGNGRIVRRDDFNKLSPAEQSDIAGKANKGELQILD